MKTELLPKPKPVEVPVATLTVTAGELRVLRDLVGGTTDIERFGVLLYEFYQQFNELAEDAGLPEYESFKTLAFLNTSRSNDEP